MTSRAISGGWMRSCFRRWGWTRKRRDQQDKEYDAVRKAGGRWSGKKAFR
jgi:hypothetical protein